MSVREEKKKGKKKEKKKVIKDNINAVCVN